MPEFKEGVSMAKKPSTIIKQAAEHHRKAEALLESLREKLVNITGDDRAHFTFSTDGIAICWNDMNNSFVSFMDIDQFMELTDREAALKILEKASG